MTTKPRIHFIDDDPTAGDLFRRFSRDKNYDVQIFRDPVEALQDINDNSSSLVITDLSMPNMSGLELLETIRNTDIELPVIMITGFSTEDNAIKALRLGAADFIKKPFDMDKLFAQIDLMLNDAIQRKQEKQSRPSMEDQKNQFGMIGESEPISNIYKIIDKISGIRCNVVI